MKGIAFKEGLVVSYGGFNLAIERAFLFSSDKSLNIVSISQSRIFSFQGLYRRIFGACKESFNLAIENLFFSSLWRVHWNGNAVSIRFNLAIENLFFSRTFDDYQKIIDYAVSISQSRIFSFQEQQIRRTRRNEPSVSISQSRIFSFQDTLLISCVNSSLNLCFNLAIENLFFSSLFFS